MPTKKEDKKAATDNNQDAPIKPQQETLHTTDPQKKMKGPISSLMHEAGEGFDSSKTKEEADEEKEKNA